MDNIKFQKQNSYPIEFSITEMSVYIQIFYLNTHINKLDFIVRV